MSTKTADPLRCAPPTPERLVALIRRHYQSQEQVRRGICLLNAGQYAAAQQCFQTALQMNHSNLPLASYLAASLVGQGRMAEAVEALAQETTADPDVTAIRRAHLLCTDGRRDEAIQTLRAAVKDNPEGANLHYQLGVLLADAEAFEEAELRFVQTLNIEPGHAEAAVKLALCCGARHAPGEAVALLRRAQAASPHDARVALLLTQALSAARSQCASLTLRVHARMPDDISRDESGQAALARVIRQDPDFVDAFLAIPSGTVDEDVFTMLLETLHRVLADVPEHVELRWRCAQVLNRLGRHEEAIREHERAIAADPKCVQALIELGRLYQRTDHKENAVARLEQALRAGAEYADVYYMLGNLYRDLGRPEDARTAYRQALRINDRYAAASEALRTLAVA